MEHKCCECRWRYWRYEQNEPIDWCILKDCEAKKPCERFQVHIPKPPMNKLEKKLQLISAALEQTKQLVDEILRGNYE